MCWWIPTEQTCTEISFSLQIYENQNLCEGKYSRDAYAENIYDRESTILLMKLIQINRIANKYFQQDYMAFLESMKLNFTFTKDAKEM